MTKKSDSLKEMSLRISNNIVDLESEIYTFHYLLLFLLNANLKKYGVLFFWLYKPIYN